jgi:hypothetical protein
MSTCTHAKFSNVDALQVAALMRLIGSEHNTGVGSFELAYPEPDGSYSPIGSSKYLERAYRHISVLKIEPSRERQGTFTVEVRINTFFEPAAGEVSETAENGLHWGFNGLAPTMVPRSLVLAMHDTLGIFLTE